MSKEISVEEAIHLETQVEDAERVACVDVLSELSTTRLRRLHTYYKDKRYFEGERDLSAAIAQVLKERKVRL